MQLNTPIDIATNQLIKVIEPAISEPHNIRSKNAKKCHNISAPALPFSLSGGDEYIHIQKRSKAQKKKTSSLNKRETSRGTTTKIMFRKTPVCPEILPDAIAL
jgi:hypothetical protein